MTAGWRPLGPPARPAPPSPFARLARAHAFAMAGDTLVTMALAGSLFFSISPTAARGRVLLSLVLTMAPFAVVAPFLGPAIDRTRRGRRAMVIASGVGRGIAALLMVPVLDTLLLFPVALAMLVLSKAYSVAKSALVPSAVRRPAELVEANSKLAITGVVAGLAVAGPGVVVLQLAGAPWVLRLAAVLFAGAAIAAAGVAERVSPPSASVESASTPGAGRHLVTTAVAMGLLRAAVGFLTFLVAFDFRRPPTAPAWWFGVVLAASMISNLLGAAVAPRLRDRFPEEWLVTGALATVGVVGAVLVRSPATGRAALATAAVMAAAVGLAAATAKLAFDAVVQRDAPEAGRGRAFARFEAAFQLVWVLGALVPVVLSTPQRTGLGVLATAGLLGAAGYTVARRGVGAGAGTLSP